MRGTEAPVIMPLNDWPLMLLLLAGGFVVGLLIEYIVLAKLRKIAAQSAWHLDDVVIASLRGVPPLWVVLIIARHIATDDLVQKAIVVAWIASLTLVISRLLVGALRLALQRSDMTGAGTILVVLLRIVVFSVGALIALQNVGIEILPILTALGVGGLAVALAMQDTLANLFSGLSILASRGIRVGDDIRLDNGEEGTVSDVSWRMVTVRTAGGNLVVVPNSKLAAAVVTNYSLPDKSFTLVIPFEVSYQSNLEQVETLCISLAEQAAGPAQAGPCKVLFTGFGDHGLQVRISIVIASWSEQFQARHRIVKALHTGFAQAGITIPFPTRVIIHQQQPPASTHVP